MLLPVEWAGPAHDPLRRPRRRRQAQDPARDDLPRAAGARVDAQRRPGPRRPARAARRRPGLRRARRELPRGARRAARRAAAADRHPPRERRGEHGRGLRQAHRPPGHLHGHARAGGDERVQRRAHRVPGLDADAPARSGRSRATRSGARPSRSSTTAPMFGPIAKWATQIDDAARLPELIARAFAVATSGRPGPVVLALPEDMLADARRRARRARRTAPLAGARPRAARHRAAAASCSAQARAPLAIVGEGGWTGADRAPTSPPSPRPSACRSPRRSAARTTSTTPRPPTPATPASAMDPALAAAHPRGRPAAGHRRAPGRDPDRRLHARAPRRADQRLVHVHPDPDEIGAVYQPELGIVAGLEAFAAAARGAGAGGRRAPRRACSRRRAASTSATWHEARELPGAAADVGGHGDAARAPAGRRDPHQRRRQLQRLGAPLLRVPPLPDAARPAQRLDGLRASRPRSPPRRCTPTARSSASPATATS